MREQFLSLQHQVIRTSGTGAAADGVRARIQETFERIECGMSLDSMTEEEIAKMEQWRSIDGKLAVLHDALFHTGSEDIDWDKVRDAAHHATLMVQNARYRLDPAAQSGLCTEALLTAGTSARRAYEAQLNPRERRLNHQRFLLMKTLAGRAPTAPAGFRR